MSGTDTPTTPNSARPSSSSASGSSATANSGSGVAPRRKSSLHQKMGGATLPRNFHMPSVAESGVGGAGSGPLGSRPPSATAGGSSPALSRVSSARKSLATHSANSSMGSGIHLTASPSPRSQSPSTPGGHRRHTLGDKKGSSDFTSSGSGSFASISPAPPRLSKPPVPTFEGGGSATNPTTPRTRKSMAGPTLSSLSLGSGSRVSFGGSSTSRSLTNSRDFNEPDSAGITSSTSSVARRKSSFATLPNPVSHTPTRSSSPPPPNRTSRKSIAPAYARTLTPAAFAAAAAAQPSSSPSPSPSPDTNNATDSTSDPSSTPNQSSSSPSALLDFKPLPSGSDGRENIHVVVRCRPFIKEDTARGQNNGRRSVQVTSDAVNCVWKGENKKFTFDKVFGEGSTQRDVYRECAGGLIDQALKGYNTTIFAYGQTGSGSEFAKITRNWGAIGFNHGSDESGIVPRAVDHVFEYIRQQLIGHAAQSTPKEDQEDGEGEGEQDGSASTSKIAEETLGEVQYLVALQFMEVYNEQVRDLLALTGSKVNLDVREDVATGSFYCAGLSQHIVTSRAELIDLIQKGNGNRCTSSTIMNEHSSRSHSMLTLTIEKSYSKRADDSEEADQTFFTSSKINIVDLAGSERLTTSAGDKTGKETVAINLSLTTLANVIAALTSTSGNQHIPYRDSKLTRLLKDSLGGNAKTLMVACINPVESSLPETVSTLRYASRAKKIQNRAVVNMDPKDAMLKALHEEIQQLKAMLLDKNKLALRMFHLVNDLHVDANESKQQLMQDQLSPTALQGVTAKPLLMPAEGETTTENGHTDGVAADSNLTETTEGTSQEDKQTTETTAAAEQDGESDSSTPATTDSSAAPSHPIVKPGPLDLESSEALIANPVGLDHALQLSSRGSMVFELEQLKAIREKLTAHNINMASIESSQQGQQTDESTAMANLGPGATSSALAQLPSQSFYNIFKDNVLNLYTSLLANQQSLAHKRSQLTRALQRIEELEDTLAQKEEEAAAFAVHRRASRGRSRSASPTARASSDAPFAPTSPTAVINEVTRRLRLGRKGSSASRRSSVSKSRSSSKPASPRLSPMDPSSMEEPPEFAAEKQRFLQMQASMEAMRTALEEKEEELAAARASINKAREDAEAKARVQLNHAQSESLDRARRIEELETELEKFRLHEERWSGLVLEHQAVQHERHMMEQHQAASGMRQPSFGSPFSPSPPGRMSLPFPSPMMFASPSPTPSPIPALTSSPATTSTPSPAAPSDELFALPTFESRLSYLRMTLHQAARNIDLIKERDVQLMQAQHMVQAAEEQVELFKTKAELHEDQTKELNKKLEDQMQAHEAKLAELQKSHEEELASLRSKLDSLSSHEEQLTKLQQDHAVALAAANQSHRSELERLLVEKENSYNNLHLQFLHLQEEHSSLVSLVHQMEADAEASATAAPAHSAVDHANLSREWLDKTLKLQNHILELTSEIQEMRNSKRELVKNSAQELKRMRMELLQLKGIPIPKEAMSEWEDASSSSSSGLSPHALHSPSFVTSSPTHLQDQHGDPHKSCVVQ